MWGPQYKNDILHELELLSVLQRTTYKKSADFL